MRPRRSESHTPASEGSTNSVRTSTSPARARAAARATQRRARIKRTCTGRPRICERAPRDGLHPSSKPVPSRGTGTGVHAPLLLLHTKSAAGVWNNTHAQPDARAPLVPCREPTSTRVTRQNPNDDDGTTASIQRPIPIPARSLPGLAVSQPSTRKTHAATPPRCITKRQPQPTQPTHRSSLSLPLRVHTGRRRRHRRRHSRI